MEVGLFITGNNKTTFSPVVQENIVWQTERKNSPGKLTFTIVNDNIVNIQEGNAVRLDVDGKGIFYGFVFTKKSDKNSPVSITAYDQLRYLKNKDTYVYTNKTASEFIQMIANDFRLNTGLIENTKYKIASRVEDNTSLFDMIGNALDTTLTNTKTMYVLYDDFGKLTLKSPSNMKLNLIIDEETGENYSYTSTIDEQTYNKIKLSYENEESGSRDIYVSQDSSNMNNWGVLQYYDTLSDGENGKAKADALLNLYNAKTKNLKIEKAFGDVRVRAGTLVVVRLKLDDVTVHNYMLVEKCVHTFRESEHYMDLTLRGGEFNG